MDNSAKLFMTECGLAVVIESVENDSEEIVTIKVPVVLSVRDIDKDMKVAMEEDIEEDVTSPNDNIIGALKGFSSFSKVTIIKNLESLLKESMQLNAHETKMVVEMIMIESKEKVQEIHQSFPFCQYCLRVFRERTTT